MSNRVLSWPQAHLGLARPLVASSVTLGPTFAENSPIGLQLRHVDGLETVGGVELGSPADLAGLRVGDVVLAVGGKAALSIEQAM